jgi:uncharacterized protein (DUF305 family)
MNTFTKTIAAAALAAGLAGGAYAQSSHGSHGSHGTSSAAMPGMDPEMMSMMAEMQPKPTDTASTKEFKVAHKVMMKDMHKPFTGDADVDFRVHMIPHHQGAIDMARIALKHAKDPETKKLAEAVIKEQEREIAEMQAWLKKNGK